MAVLYLSTERETEGPGIPHDIIYNILSEANLENDRNSERKTS